MKLSRIAASLLATSALLFPAVAPAQTTADLNTQLVSTLQQLIIVLQNELQQLLALHQAPPTSSPAPSSSNTGNQANGDGTLPIPGAPSSDTWLPFGANTDGTSGSFSATPTSGSAPLTVTFSGNVSGTSFSIIFGDGSVSPISACAGGCPSSATINITHTYTSAGFYLVTLQNGSGARIGIETILVRNDGAIPFPSTPVPQQPPAQLPAPQQNGGNNPAPFTGGLCTFINRAYQNGASVSCTENPGAGACPLGVPVSTWVCSNGQWVAPGTTPSPNPAVPFPSDPNADGSPPGSTNTCVTIAAAQTSTGLAECSGELYCPNNVASQRYYCQVGGLAGGSRWSSTPCTGMECLSL
jgi:PKD repeat protein